MAAHVRLRTAQLNKLCNLAGLKTVEARAEAFGVNASTVSRVVRGDTVPGERFIAGVLSAFAGDGFGFSDFFEVIDDPGDGEAA